MRSTQIALGAAFVVVVLAMSSLFIVDEREQALVLQFGQVRDVKTEPGLGFKLPFIQNVVKYEKRILSLETDSLEVTPLDDRRLVVDAFARWRITDPVQFRQAVQNESAAEPRLRRILTAALREVLGTVDSNALLSGERVALMDRITRAARSQAQALGVQVIDVRIRRTDLPAQNLAATFARMQAERQREAEDLRARGREAAQKVRASADRRAVELVSEARKDSEIIRGEADARRNAVFAQAYGRDPEFFAFYRSLAAYARALRGENSTLVIAPDSEFFQYLKSNSAEAEIRAAMPTLITPEESGASGPVEEPEGDEADEARASTEPADAPTGAEPTGAVVTE